MNINEIGTSRYYSAWQRAGRVQKNDPRTDFADKMAETEPLNRFSDRKALTGRELELPESQKSNTESEIIVKPDGSRVLVMTISIGGMETAISLEISKPTEMPNATSKQDDSDMPAAENDTVSGV